MKISDANILERISANPFQKSKYNLKDNLNKEPMCYYDSWQSYHI